MKALGEGEEEVREKKPMDKAKMLLIPQTYSMRTSNLYDEARLNVEMHLNSIERNILVKRYSRVKFF